MRGLKRVLAFAALMLLAANAAAQVPMIQKGAEGSALSSATNAKMTPATVQASAAYSS